MNTVLPCSHVPSLLSVSPLRSLPQCPATRSVAYVTAHQSRFAAGQQHQQQYMHTALKAADTESAQGSASSPAPPAAAILTPLPRKSLKKNPAPPAKVKDSKGKPPKQVAFIEEEVEEDETSEESREPVVLDELSPYYQPALTDDDLDEDPPGHKSGYVAVIGKPNAGKSTLINALVGQKLSIVTYKPQTTRHRIMGIASDKHYQMILFDTPGIMDKKRTVLEERMMAAVVTSIQNAEAIIAVVDSRINPKEALSMFQPGVDWKGPPMAVLLNKADLLSQQEIDELSAWYKENCRAEAVFAGSALNNQGVTEIKEWAVQKLPEGPTLYPKGIVSEQPERFFVSECIREQIFLAFEQEVPYCTQVTIKEFKERPGKKDYVLAEIMVEKESHKPIIIGRNGDKLKKLGQDARKEIEAFLGRPVYLELSVQVAEGWRDSKESLKKYGYFDPMLI